MKMAAGEKIFDEVREEIFSKTKGRQSCGLGRLQRFDARGGRGLVKDGRGVEKVQGVVELCSVKALSLAEEAVDKTLQGL